MSSDPLLLPEIWSDLPKGGAAESARSDFVANGRSGLVLIDYAGGSVPSDSPPVVRPLDRTQQALEAGGHVPGPASAALAKGLSDLTAIVTQAEALLRAQGTLKGDVHFAVERIHDVALALRMRDVNSALCDMLEASVREVGDAVVRHEAAATGAMSAAALLGDIMHRIEELMRMLAVRAEAATGPSTPGATSRVDDGFAIGPSAPPAPGTKVVVAALASAAFEAQPVDDVPLPIARQVEHPLEAPVATDASQAPATIDPLPAAATCAYASGAQGRATGFAAGPLAYSAPMPTADPPLTAAVDRLPPDGVAAEDPVSAASMCEPTISNDETFDGATSDGLMSADAMSVDVVAVDVVAVHATSESDAASDHGVPDTTITDASDARVSLDALSDGSVMGNEALREPKPLAEADDAVPVEQAAAVATHLQNEINAPAETVAAESVPAEMVAARNGVTETVAAEVIGAEMVPAEIAAAETASGESVVADMVAAGPADGDQPIAAPPVGEATAAALPAAAAESDAKQLQSPAFVGKGVTAAQTMIRRPASDPLAAFYGLSEEELIALFS